MEPGEGEQPGAWHCHLGVLWAFANRPARPADQAAPGSDQTASAFKQRSEGGRLSEDVCSLRKARRLLRECSRRPQRRWSRSVSEPQRRVSFIGDRLFPGGGGGQGPAKFPCLAEDGHITQMGLCRECSSSSSFFHDKGHPERRAYADSRRPLC